jgi:hypothetical protein
LENDFNVSRIRHQVFLVGLMLAFTAVSSAMAPIAFGHRLRSRAKDRSQLLLRRTRRRLNRARALVKLRTKPALAFFARVRSAA